MVDKFNPERPDIANLLAQLASHSNRTFGHSLPSDVGSTSPTKPFPNNESPNPGSNFLANLIATFLRTSGAQPNFHMGAAPDLWMERPASGLNSHNFRNYNDNPDGYPWDAHPFQPPVGPTSWQASGWRSGEGVGKRALDKELLEYRTFLPAAWSNKKPPGEQ